MRTKIEAGRRRRDSAISDTQRGSRPAHIVYRGPPADKAERLHRRSEQHELATNKGKNWRALTRTEKSRRIRFGSKALCRNPRDVRELARINAKIAHEREMQAVRTWRLSTDQAEILERYIGFAPSASLPASNKAVMIETSYQLSKLMMRLFKDSPRKHFYWITLIHTRWHDSHINTEIRLRQIQRDTDRVMQRSGLSWFGKVEMDLFNNWSHPRGGLMLTPHVHLIGWSSKFSTAADIRARLNASDLRSHLGTEVTDVKRVTNRRRIAHLCYYMSKPNHRGKSLGPLRPTTKKRRVYRVEKGVRPGHTLRLAEILSYMDIGELMLARGEGLRIKRRLNRRLDRTRPRSAPEMLGATSEVHEMWQLMMPTSRHCRAHVSIDRG